MKPLDFAQIPMFPRSNYEVDVGFRYLEETVTNHVTKYGLDLNPDFQRGHVWTEEQRTRYIEYILRGGEGGKVLSFNCYGWNGGTSKLGPYQILDGLQRLTSARMFMRDELRAFGRLHSEFSGALRLHAGFKWRVFELPSRAAVLRYYLDMNAGGTPHAESEIERVRKLLVAEKGGNL